MKNPQTNSKMVVITGASSGIGEALAYKYASQGCSLALTGRNKERLEGVVKLCRDKGSPQVISAVVDVTDKKAMRSWVLEVDNEHSIDLIVANAGISAGMGGLSGGDLFAQTRKIFDVNIMGVINTVEPAFEKMIERKKGQIALISSMASFSPWSGAPAYSASKAAVRFLGEGMVMSCRKNGISMSVVCPGFVKSRMTDVNDFPMPLIIDSERAAQIIVNGLERKKTLIVFPLIIYALIRIFSYFPSSFISLLTRLLPAKKGI